MVLRPLARVAYKQGEIEATREYLHLALNADHNDHQAMHMLAKLYLDQGEDPQIAEVLARQSSALHPDGTPIGTPSSKPLKRRARPKKPPKSRPAPLVRSANILCLRWPCGAAAVWPPSEGPERCSGLAKGRRPLESRCAFGGLAPVTF